MTEALRMYVVVASGLVGIVGTPVLIRHWRSWKVPNQFAWMSLILLNAATFIGTIEVLIAGTPGGFRNYLFAIAITWLLIAVCYQPVSDLRSRRTKEKP